MFLNSIAKIEGKVDGNVIDSISNLFQNFGIVPILLVSFFAVVLYLFFIWIKRLIFSSDKKKKEEQIIELQSEVKNLTQAIASSMLNKKQYSNEGLVNSLTIDAIKDLTKHPVFSNIDYILSVKLNQTTFSSKIKYDIFRDFVIVKYTIFKDNWLKYLATHKNIETTREELKDQLTKLFITIDDEVSIELSNLKIPYIALVELNKSSQIGDKFLHSSIETFIDSNNFRSAEDIIYTILNLAVQVIEVIFYDLILNLEKLNGQLEQEVYEKKNVKKSKL